MRDLRVGLARHQEPMQFPKPEAGHAGEKMMLQVIIQSPWRDQPELPNGSEHGAAFVQHILVLDRIVLGDAADIANGEKHRQKRDDPVKQQQLPEAQHDR
jgi:hypothetical protein